MPPLLISSRSLPFMYRRPRSSIIPISPVANHPWETTFRVRSSLPRYPFIRDGVLIHTWPASPGAHFPNRLRVAVGTRTVQNLDHSSPGFSDEPVFRGESGHGGSRDPAARFRDAVCIIYIPDSGPLPDFLPERSAHRRGTAAHPFQPVPSRWLRRFQRQAPLRKGRRT